MKCKRFLFELLLILLGSALYAFGTVAFVFPAGLLLGGTSGISVILNAFLPFSPGMILSAINLLLILLAFLILGKGMAAKTLIGSLALFLRGRKISSNRFKLRLFQGVPCGV